MHFHLKDRTVRDAPADGCRPMLNGRHFKRAGVGEGDIPTAARRQALRAAGDAGFTNRVWGAGRGSDAPGRGHPSQPVRRTREGETGGEMHDDYQVAAGRTGKRDAAWVFAWPTRIGGAHTAARDLCRHGKDGRWSNQHDNQRALARRSGTLGEPQQEVERRRQICRGAGAVRSSSGTAPVDRGRWCTLRPQHGTRAHIPYIAPCRPNSQPRRIGTSIPCARLVRHGIRRSFRWIPAVAKV